MWYQENLRNVQFVFRYSKNENDDHLMRMMIVFSSVRASWEMTAEHSFTLAMSTPIRPMSGVSSGM